MGELARREEAVQRLEQITTDKRVRVSRASRQIEDRHIHSLNLLVMFQNAPQIPSAYHPSVVCSQIIRKVQDWHRQRRDSREVGSRNIECSTDEADTLNREQRSAYRNYRDAWDRFDDGGILGANFLKSGKTPDFLFIRLEIYAYILHEEDWGGFPTQEFLWDVIHELAYEYKIISQRAPELAFYPFVFAGQVMFPMFDRDLQGRSLYYTRNATGDTGIPINGFTKTQPRLFIRAKKP